MKTINYGLADIGGFKSLMEYMKEYISDEYLLVESEKPDYVFCACFGKSVLPEDTIRIQFIGENLAPDFNIFDYAIGFNPIDFGDRYLRYPLYAFSCRNDFDLALKKHLCDENEIKCKENFCSFVVSNGRMEDERTKFFLELSKYKRVESGGRFLNNIGHSLPGRNGKYEFQKKCKFAIAFENSSTPGYTTEKLIEAFAAGTIPIYWGNPKIAEEFNSKAFINCHDYDNFDQVIERVMEIDNDDELYLSIIREPILYEGCIASKYVDKKVLEIFLDNIFKQDKEVAYRRESHYSQFAKNYVTQQCIVEQSLLNKLKNKLKRK